jgi:hypothetical protein
MVRVLSLGLVSAGLGILALLGLTGRSGRLTRFAAFLGTLVMVGLLVFLGITSRGSVGPGWVLVLAGCVFAYIGGRLVKR